MEHENKRKICHIKKINIAATFRGEKKGEENNL